jgi:hypothetical protein
MDCSAHRVVAVVVTVHNIKEQEVLIIRNFCSHPGIFPFFIINHMLQSPVSEAESILASQ